MSAEVTEEKAVDIAKSWLERNGFSADRRTVAVTREQGSYKVVLSVPADMLGGDYTLHVDAMTSEVFDTTFER